MSTLNLQGLKGDVAIYQSLDIGAERGRGPSMMDFVSELPRVMWEVSRLSMSWGVLTRLGKRGDGHPVMTLPGFTAGDESTLVLRRFLTRLGYVALPWLQGQNTGEPQLLEGAMRRVYRAHLAYGDKISLVGQSLGGVYAREIAREFPQAVRCVVTLGSPFAAEDAEDTNAFVRRLFESMSGQSVDDMREMLGDADPRAPLDMPSTAIYSKSDGVASWRACLGHETETSENVEVLASHSGMALNPDVLYVVADRLSQDPDQWQRFAGGRGCWSWIYPKPARLTADQ